MIKPSFWFVIKQYKVLIMEMRICEYKRIHDDEISSFYLFFQNITKIYLCDCTKIDNKFAFFTIFKSEAYYHEFLFIGFCIFYFFVTINFPNFFRIFSLFLSLFSLIIYVLFIYICFVLVVFTWFRAFLTLSLLLFLLSLIIHFLLFFLLSPFSYFFPT